MPFICNLEGIMSEQITTLTFCKYNSIRSKIWAFWMMQFSHRYLKKVKGMSFYKLMGSGQGLGFNLSPDWSVYCLLQVWENEDVAAHFLSDSILINKYDLYADERGTIFMKNLTSHGVWSGKQPFLKNGLTDESNHHVAIITRATIKTSQLIKFWKYVPTAQKPISKAKGLLYTKGIGEVPVKQMATFSVWDNIENMKQFAYNSEEHQTAIKMTREFNWYAEELFARFQPYKMIGTWEGSQWRFSN